MKMSCDDNPKLKILFIAGWYPSEDNPVSGIFIKEHAKAVSIYNDVVVLHSRQSNSPAKNHLEIFDEVEDGMRTIRTKYSKSPIPKITRFIHLYSVWKIFRKLLKEKWKPDVIHAHIFSAGMPAVIIGKLFRIPVVITEHYTNFPTHSLTIRDRKIAKFAMNRADIILPVSDDLRQAIGNYYGIGKKFMVVPNVVNTKVFYPSYSGCERKNCGKKRILCVCILSPRKGIYYLLKSLCRLKQKRQDFVLDIVGDGPNRKEYEELTKSLGIDELVKFHGRQPEVASFMRSCDFFVLPSLYENFGVVYIEAMACGKPVIGTNAGGPKEIITAETGNLVQPKDTDGLTRAIDNMLDHHKNYSPEKISQYTKDKFSHEVVGRKLDDIYRNLLREDFRDYPTGNSGYKIQIRDGWKVLDVGAGHNPHQRADVILDKYVEDDEERAGSSLKIRTGQRFVEGDACSMQFRDKEFDYIIASHIAEHVDDPEEFCKELIRVSKRGYIETPSRFTEIVLGELFHKWYVYTRNGTLIFRKIKRPKFVEPFRTFFYAIYYMNIRRPGRKTICFSNKYLKYISIKLITYLLKKPWIKFRRLTYTCFEWENQFDYEIIK